MYKFKSKFIALIKSKKSTVSLVAFSLCLYFLFATQVPRSDFWTILSLFSLLFIAYLIFVYQKLNWKIILGLGISFRVVFLFVLPELSDDFYRFYWDGLQSLGGTSPFAYLPSEVSDSNIGAVYSKLNSPNYYSVYPGINQLIYLICAYLGESLIGFVITAKILMLLAELGSFYFLYQLLGLKKKPVTLLSWYFLNPLVVLEFAGNLHFEGFMLCALLGSFYFFSKQKNVSSSVCVGLACAIKIMPFLFVPLYFVKSGTKSKWLFVVIPLLVFFVTLLPFFHVDMLSHINESIQLYFGKFEFNSSFFLLFTWAGLPQVFLKVLLLAGLGTTSFWVYTEKTPLELALVWLFTWYLLLSQSVHPWYVAGFLGITVVNEQRYVVLWTYMIFLTYITYQTTNYEQQLWVNIIEYSLVLFWLCKDIKNEFTSSNMKTGVAILPSEAKVE